MPRVVLPVVAVAVVICISGCGGSDEVAVEDAAVKVKLSNARVDREFGEDVFLIDYEFTHGRPVTGALYRLVMVSGSGQEYYTNEYFNEKSVSGTLEVKMPFLLAEDEPSRRFEARLDKLLNTGPHEEYETLSNTISIEATAAN